MPFVFSSRLSALRATRPGVIAQASSSPPARPLCSSCGGGGGGGGGKSSFNASRKVGEDENGDGRNKKSNAAARAAVGAALLASPLAAAVRPARAGPVRASSSSSAGAEGGGIEKLKSSLKAAGLSVLLGYAAAAVIKTVGKTAATLAFLAWALVQYLSTKKVFSVDWEGMFKKVGSKATWFLDLDRDGSIGVGDVKAAVNKASKLVGRTKASSGAAFVVGLAWGLGVLPLP